MTNLELQKTANEIRKSIVTAVHSAKAGHPGGSLSAADIFTYLYLSLIHISPDVVIIMLGTNDSKQKYWDAERYEEQYLALIDELHNLPGHPYLYLMAPPEAFPAEEGEILYGINNDVIGGEIRNLVPDIAEQSGCGTLDLYALTQDHPEYFVDGIHPTEEGRCV